MKQPQVRIWIDAKGETPDPADSAKVIYTIPFLDDEEIKQKLVQALFALVKEIEILPECRDRVKITYNPKLISPGFVDYTLRQRGLDFLREQEVTNELVPGQSL